MSLRYREKNSTTASMFRRAVSLLAVIGESRVTPLMMVSMSVLLLLNV
ncbi:hypothetical protein ACFFX0_20375 [Citricoccus parietis]|uniref:Uncharacterized protein n=1 Tax=Citricoccus parietis TaxID=592307 RepID=A0ABV5G3C1_9MICC